MALTQISTQGIKDGTITGTDLATNLSITGDLSVDTNTLHVDSTNNRVGIGTASPTIALEVVKNTQGGIKLTDTAVTDASFEIRPQTGNHTKLFRIIDSTASVDRLTIDTSGIVNIAKGIKITEDNKKLQLGASQDLQIYHDGTDSFIDFSNALKISDDGVVKAVWTNTYYGLLDNIKLNLGTGLDTEIYHDGTDTFINQKTNALKFDYNGTTKYYFTTSFLTFQDNFKAAFGTSQDLQIFHDGNNSKISHVGAGGLYIGADTFGLQKGDHSENYITMAANGAVELYHNNVKKFETTSSGVSVTGQLSTTDTISTVGNLDMSDSTSTGNNRIMLGTGDDLQIYHASNSIVQNNNNGVNLILQSEAITFRANSDTSEKFFKCIKDGAVELYHNNNKHFETATNGGIFRGTTWTAVDNCKIAFGSGDDLQIYHDGSNSYIYQNGTGELRANTATFRVMDRNGGETQLLASQNGAVELYYDNSKKFETTSGGVDVTGALTVNGAAIGGGGKVIQVLRTTASMSSTSSASFQSTGLSQAITMTNSANKVLAIATGGFNNASAGAGGGASIFRGTANLAHSNDLMASYFGEDDSNNIEYTATFTSLDTPGAGTHTYTVQLRAFSGTMRFAYRNTGVLTLIELDYS